MEKYRLKMLISGGQTGVDRSALDFAMLACIHCSGWCPLGRRAEDGVIPAKYSLIETSSPLYQHRTRLNVKDSDATLIFTDGGCSRGTALTVKCCQLMQKPYLTIFVSDFSDSLRLNILQWLQKFKPEILNIAGPRLSECPAARKYVFNILAELLCSAECPPPVWPPERPSSPSLPFLS
ncbi:MAG: hypothetical protein EOM80_17575 [Erysipelotrichia bacterium]|nr:hypothetical protein [Erysipelotrichia bacterium]